ncbi:hypothetical protein OROGR_024749 [Orobanche gracilis]
MYGNSGGDSGGRSEEEGRAYLLLRVKKLRWLLNIKLRASEVNVPFLQTIAAKIHAGLNNCCKP